MKIEYFPTRSHPKSYPKKTVIVNTVIFWTLAIIGLLVMLTWASRALLVSYLIAWLSIMTVGRYATCARCECYGRDCPSFSVGRITSLYMARVEGKGLNLIGGVIDFLGLSFILIVPLFYIIGHHLILFIIYLGLTLFLLFYWNKTGCRYCPVDICPSHLLAVKLFGKPLDLTIDSQQLSEKKDSLNLL